VVTVSATRPYRTSLTQIRRRRESLDSSPSATEIS
jgi:hypothetical protein